VRATKRYATGSRIRELREDHGVPLTDLAARIDVSASHLSRMECGLAASNVTVAATIAEVSA
jgi:transcriptional regulator with XRE-family HTH domain